MGKNIVLIKIIFFIFLPEIIVASLAEDAVKIENKKSNFVTKYKDTRKTKEELAASVSQHTIKTKEKLAASLGQIDTKNIVIFNDIYEKFEDFKLSNENFYGFPATIDFMKATLENQLVLCTNSLVINYILLGSIWHSFIKDTIKQLQVRYAFLDNFTPTEIADFKHVIIEINNLINNHYGADFFDEKLNFLLSDAKLNSEQLYWLFLLHKFYIEMMEKLKNYNIYEVNDLYSLFVPKNEKLNNYFRKLKKIELTELNSFLLTKDKKVDLDIDKYFIDTLKKIIFSHRNFDVGIEGDYKDIDFKWNIFMFGHGNSSDLIVGVSHNAFIQALNYFKQASLINTLTILSCFTGGKKLTEFFGKNFFDEITSSVKNLNYTVLFFAPFFSVTFSGSIYTWGTYKQNFKDGAYELFFKNIEQGAYFKALRTFQAMIKREETFSNYGAVKFPNINLITFDNNQENIFNINNNLVATFSSDSSLEIPENKNIVLMNTDFMPIHIHINLTKNKFNFKFLPVFYTNQEYVIDSLKIDGVFIDPNNKDPNIVFTLYNLFSMKLEELSEPIIIYIKKVDIGGTILKDVVVYLFNEEIIYFKYLDRNDTLLSAAFSDNQMKISAVDNSEYYQELVTNGKRKLIAGSDGNKILSEVKPGFIKKIQNIYAHRTKPLNPKAKIFIPNLKLIKPLTV